MCDFDLLLKLIQLNPNLTAKLVYYVNPFMCGAAMHSLSALWYYHVIQFVVEEIALKLPHG